MPRKLLINRILIKNDGTTQIELTQGKWAIIDSEDYPKIKHLKWHAHLENKTWYALCPKTIKKKRIIIRMHRLICSTPKGMFSDHINHNGLDNRKINLRPATYKQNVYNSKRNITSKNGYHGVVRRVNRYGYSYRCRFRHNYKQVFAGTFHTAKEAAIAYDKAIVKYRGEFSVLNFPKATKPC